MPCPEVSGKLLFSIGLARWSDHVLIWERALACRRSYLRRPDQESGSRRMVVTRLGIIVISMVAGAVIAVGAAFGVASLVSGASVNPPSHQLYNYGTP